MPSASQLVIAVNYKLSLWSAMWCNKSKHIWLAVRKIYIVLSTFTWSNIWFQFFLELTRLTNLLWCRKQNMMHFQWILNHILYLFYEAVSLDVSHLNKKQLTGERSPGLIKGRRKRHCILIFCNTLNSLCATGSILWKLCMDFRL